LLQKKLAKLKDILRDYPGAIIAFSGGVDSSLLLMVANDVLKDHLIAVTANSPIFSEDEIQVAKKIARRLSVNHIIIQTNNLRDPRFVANSKDRCFYCKQAFFKKVNRLAHKYQYVVLDATNKSDLQDFRPGFIAIKELGVKSPFIEAGIDKKAIRSLAKNLGLPNWNRPANACLATRIPYGTLIDKVSLKRIAYAESHLRRFKLTQLRMRDHFPIARIEVLPSEFKKLLLHRSAIIKYFKKMGYKYITLDLSGYRTGSMNINGSD